MLALYRSGRQAEALDVLPRASGFSGRRARHRAAARSSPGSRRAILEQDASLAGPAAHERASGVPSGTVTFLFTDIEGSTQLLNELGRDRYAEILDEHERLLRAAFAAHQGRVVDTQGDSFFVAFRTAADAVAAAVDAQRDLAAEHWPHGGAVRVRMGLHTGEPRVGEQRYVGIGVHRAARIGAAGHGGQVLLSSTTRELAEEDLPAGVSVRDLGERRLKDLDQPQHLYQLDIDGLQNEFAQLRTLDVELRRKRRRMYIGSALIGVVAAAVAIPVFAFGQGGSDRGVTVEGNAVAVIDPDSNRVDGCDIRRRPSGRDRFRLRLALGRESRRPERLADRSRHEQRHEVDPGRGPADRPRRGGRRHLGRRLERHRPFGESQADRPAVRHGRPEDPDRQRRARRPGRGGALGKTVWIAPSSGLLTRLDPRTGGVVKRSIRTRVRQQ